MTKPFALCFLLTVLLHTLATAEDWPQWQGPDRNAVSKETGLLQQWPEAGPTLAWSTDGLGGGDTAPAVADGKLFGMSNREGQEIVWALSEADGKEIWATPLGDAIEQRMPQSKEGPGGTPTVDGDRLYAIGMGGTVACLQVENGGLVWNRSLTEDFGGILPTWSYRESPLIDGSKLICTPGSDDALLVALNKQDGSTLWKAAKPAAAQRADNQSTPASPQQTNRSERRGGPASSPPAMAQQRQATNNGPPQVTGTEDPELFLSEHWGMTAFAYKVPNGKYSARLYFAETYDGISEEGGRVFSMNVEGIEIKDFDIWERAGGPRKAHIETVPIEVSDEQFDITFTRQVENPVIKAIELLPRPGTVAEAIRIKAGQASPFTDSKGQVWLADTGFEGGATSPGFVSFGRFGGRGRRGGGFGGGFGGRQRSGAAYSSVIAIDWEGQRQYVQLTADTLLAVAAEDGKLLWQYDAPANRMGINCSTPLYQDGLIFAASAYGNGGGAVKLTKTNGGEIKAEEVYFANRMQNHHGGMIVIDGALYGANGGNEGGFLTCLDFQTGDLLWRDRDAPKGALLFADGRLYLRAEGGEVLLIEPSREKLIVRGRFQQPDRSSSPAWSHPIIANGKLYIRDQGLLLCYDIKSLD
ncbi:MAG: PQQ-binding-like beta-propeller repeat protein [bacterium]|nr:PQQ-binding-like beta-propeller repeat protein [bacterium]